MDTKEDIFVGVGDIFHGVTVGPDDIPSDVKEFERRLTCMFSSLFLYPLFLYILAPHSPITPHPPSNNNHTTPPPPPPPPPTS